jgi:hypothetical protein
MSEHPSDRLPLTPLEQLGNVIDSLFDDELIEGIKMEDGEPSDHATQLVRAAIRKALGDEAIGLLGTQQPAADVRPSSWNKFIDFVIDLAYEKFPDDASFIGDGAIRALALGGVTFASPAAAYRMDVGGSLAIIAALVALAKQTYGIISKHREFTEAEIIGRVTTDLKEHGPLPGAIDDKTLQFVVRRTIEYANRDA